MANKFILRQIFFTICVLFLTTSYSKTKEVIIRGIIDQGVGDNYIQKLETATKLDTVYLYIKSCGGTVKEGAKIIRAMQKTDAKTVVEVVDYVESLAAIIILFADQVYIRPDAIVMYHLPRTKNGEIAFINSIVPGHKEMAMIVVEWIKSRDGLLSNKQWGRFLLGENIFISGDTFISRIKNAKKSLPLSGERYEPWRVIRCNPDYRYFGEE